MLRAHHLVEVLLRPAHEAFEHGHERLAGGRERIFHARGHLGIDRAAHKVVLLQVAQRLREHFLGTIEHFAVKLAETQRAGRVLVEVIEHEERPFVAELAHHLADGAREVGGVYLGCHRVEKKESFDFAAAKILTFFRKPSLQGKISKINLKLFSDFLGGAPILTVWKPSHRAVPSCGNGRKAVLLHPQTRKMFHFLK